MPTTLISTRRARSAEQRLALMDCVHRAMVATLKIPVDDRCIRIQEFAAEDFAVQAEMSEDFTLVEISLFPGRSLDAKRALYQTLVAELGSLGIAPLDIRVILNEVPKENWGLRGGIAGCDLNLSVKVEV